jgi:ribonuclease D
VPDSALVAAARALPETKRDLAALREFNGRASRSQLDRWWNAIQLGLTTDDLPQLRATGDTIPAPRVWSDKNPEADKRLKAARAAVTTVGETMSIPVENLLTPELLRRIAWTPPEPLAAETVRAVLEELGARAWQVEATAQVIHDAFVEASQVAETPPSAGS